MNKYFKIFLIFSLVFLFSHQAFAAGLVPCGTSAAGSSPCTPCHLWDLANNVIKFIFVGLAIPILTVVMIWGGVLMMTGGADSILEGKASAGNITKGKKMLVSGVVGIFIAAGAWLIVTTIVHTFAGTSVSDKYIVGWADIECDLDSQPPPQPPIPPPGPVTPPPPPPAGNFPTEDAGRTFFQNAGIGIVSTGNCSDPNNSSCTSVIGLPQSTANHLSGLHQNSGLNFNISGGTETGHSEHGIGRPVVDLQPTGGATFAQIQSQIRTLGGQAYCENQGGTQRIENCGGATNHVHVVWP